MKPKPTAPQSTLEAELVRIWERAFHRAPIGTQDDFFDLGGTSVQAVRIFAQIEEVFHRRMAISTILGAPTIEQLAAALAPGKSRERNARVVSLQAEGERPAVFCIGGAYQWRAVAKYLGAEQPVFCIELETGAVERAKGPNPMEKLARQMVSVVSEQQSRGPYYLCGYCQDGLFAYEMARQLKLYGCEVGLLALVETRNPFPPLRARVASELRRVAWRLAFQADQLRRLARTRDARPYVRARREQLKRFKLRMLSRVSPGYWLRARQSGRVDMREFFDFSKCFSRPKPLACPTVLFRCAEWPILSGGDPYFGWRGLLTGPVETHELPGDHEGIFREPQVQALAAKLRACLQNAARAGQSFQSSNEQVATRVRAASRT